ncbi:unnamed protein product [Orchesella dallaii]|uniref:Uncharacterized protein n=1 Tax=Orchesella dallaii TaxID=48710 RepID=A0ABP1RJL8_9HEXA
MLLEDKPGDKPSLDSLSPGNRIADNKATSSGRCDLKSCVGCSTAGCWFCGVGNEMECVPQQHNCPNGSAFVLPPSTKELCPSTTTISPSTKAPPTASSNLTFILIVAVGVMVGFALSVVLVDFWFNRMNDRVRAMQNRPVDDPNIRIPKHCHTSNTSKI